MSNLKRKIENIKIDNKEYIMAFDMESIEVFKELTGKGVLASLDKLSELDDEIILYFIASTLRDEKTEKVLGNELFNGEYDLFSLVISLFPVVLDIVNSGFPKSSKKKSSKGKITELDVDFLYYCFTKILGGTEEEFWKSTPCKIFKLLDIHADVNGINKNNKDNDSDIKTFKVLD